MSTSARTVFRGSSGELTGKLEMPIGDPKAWALFAHCFTCGKDNAAAGRISRALAAQGIAVLRFDFTGLGESEGEFAATGFSSNVEDLVHAADHLRDQFSAPAVLIGHSLGGAAVLAAASRIPEVRAVVTIGAPADPFHVVGLLGDALPGVEAGEATVSIGGRPFRVRREFLDDIAMQPQCERIAALDTALLVMHSPLDEVVSVNNARIIFDTARHPKSFITLDGADHLLSNRADAGYTASVLAAWLSRYVAAPTATRDLNTDDLADGAVRVAESGPGRLTQQIGTRRHRLTADEPRPIGDDAGPTPYDLLLAALGACTSMTVRMYADRKQWPLERIVVDSRHSRVHAKDCAECETATGMVDRIERDITLIGPLDGDQRAKLLDIADRCPVHRTLRSEVSIHTADARADRDRG
ncbi:MULTISPECIES: bifunctional alpha/beta hydrolase/OsmC family protein [Mycobacteriaceae]|jgi:putative redox protein|uniref:Osmotically inducible protein C n=3 Tax=Mycobacteriaceae TaxID=1762 RepID=A0A0F5MV20_9MYCO|nr:MULTISPECIES: bifunctional alpha/beta hydrolase/OsmC family protein [Mycobacteriaceae]MBX9921884.1 bifunctional alpha/beta hydrolase/OsmC family protein [Mycolicibacterium frederiksbergense]OKH80134.1 osmotically inducible protein C [Mycobacterium sp. SWH-M3]UHJ53478.1 bifunctional alpha/beta hydrolase/OsmC family protein [Mycolicibacterium fortuitum]KKB98668.1 osmotically inducible protein C [Mycolicibacter arupensis]KRQ20741.1 osmotically inducible protein C [Mycobacteroides sp. H003]